MKGMENVTIKKRSAANINTDIVNKIGIAHFDGTSEVLNTSEVRFVPHSHSNVELGDTLSFDKMCDSETSSFELYINEERVDLPVSVEKRIFELFHLDESKKNKMQCHNFALFIKSFKFY